MHNGNVFVKNTRQKKREAETVQKDFPLLFIFPISVLFLLLFLHDRKDEWVKNKS